MRHLRTVAAAALALVVMAGCTGDLGAPGERVSAAAEQGGIGEVGRVSITSNQLWLDYSQGNQYFTATRVKNDDVQTQPDSMGEGWIPQRPVGELQLDAFTSRLAAVEDSCDKGRYGGRIMPTIGGAVVQQIGCGDWSFKSVWIDDQEVTGITEWDEATIDRVLAEVRAVHGQTSSDLVFLTPRTASMNPAYTLRFISPQQTSATGEPCWITSSRHAESTPDRPILHYSSCASSSEVLSDEDFDLEQVSGAKILAALASGAEKLGITVNDIGGFTVLLTDGELKVQMTVASGVSAKAPIWSEIL